MTAHHETATDDGNFAESDLISLGQKLASLDLTEPERAALGALMSDDDVVGFGRFNIGKGIRVGLRMGKRLDVPDAADGFGIRVPGIRAKPGLDGDIPKPGRF